MGSLSALGGGLIGYVVPFLFVLTIVVFFHELGHFLMARLCGDQGARLFDRIWPRNRRLQRPLRHALENFRGPARRLREVLRRRQCGERAGPGCRGVDVAMPSGKTASCHKPVRLARRCSRGRSYRQFRSGDRHFRRHFHDSRQADHERTRRHDATGQRGAGGRIPARRSGNRHQRREDRRISPTCSASSASAPARR